MGITVDELDHIWMVLSGRLNSTNETIRISEKLYKIKEAAKAADKKEIQIII